MLPFWYRLTQVVLEKRPLNGRTVHNYDCKLHDVSAYSVDLYLHLGGEPNVDSGDAALYVVDVALQTHRPDPQVVLQRQGKNGKGSPYSITERRVPELITVLGNQPAGDVSRKPGSRLPLLSARPAVTPATLKRAATDFANW